jgi:hypothetical protein
LFKCSSEPCIIESIVEAQCSLILPFRCPIYINSSVRKLISCGLCWQFPETETKCGFIDKHIPSSGPLHGFCSALPISLCLRSKEYQNILQYSSFIF